MPKFKLKTLQKDGKLFEGVVEAADRFAVYDQVRKEQATVISVSEINKMSKISMDTISDFLSGVKASEKIMLARNLSAMLGAGLTVTRALDVMQRQTNNVKLKNILRAVGEDINTGTNFHTALEKFPKVFSKLFVSMVKAGEESGKLAGALENISKQMKRAYDLNKKVRGAMTYPSIIIVVMLIIGALMLTYVVPTLTKTFEELNADLPASTQFIIAVSNFLKEHTLTAALILIIVISILIMWFKTAQGRRMLDYTFLHIPIIKIMVKEVNSARTARTLSSLLSSGVEVVSAISITRDVVQNSYYKEVLKSAEGVIEKGEPISQTFIENEHLYPALVGEMIAVGEETGQLSDMLKEIAEFYEEEVEQKTKNLSTIIEPLLMIFIGVVVGFFALSMITPIYSISESI